MLFNSLIFGVFLLAVFTGHWLVGNKGVQWQNFFLLIASYFFYACWDVRFLGLLVFTTVVDYVAGQQIASAPSPAMRKRWCTLSIGISLGVLGLFKYYDFFAGSFALFLAGFNINTNVRMLELMLPIGLSFYTFHGISYILDIYNDKIRPEKNLVTYGLFVGFFPLLVAGPIERATHLLPQLKQARAFNYEQATDGLRQFTWGLFKKIVIADNLAPMVDAVFTNPEDYRGMTLVLGTILFAFQIYCDFSGYSDMAIGMARLFGIDLLRNFAFPYFSRDIAEFWRRWHISLSTWFRDYLYIPLGGNRGGRWLTARNIFVVFLLSAFWHGANWTFLAWGFLHAAFILPAMILKTNRLHLDTVAAGKLFPSLREALAMLITFGLTCFAWIFFRADSLGLALTYCTSMIRGLFEAGNFSNTIAFISEAAGTPVLIFLVLFVVAEWVQREQKHALQFAPALTNVKGYSLLRKACYAIVVFCIILFGNFHEVPFIYFQF